MITNKNFKPNAVLPKGARMLPRVVKLKIDGWNKMPYDADILMFGVRFLRVKGGFGHDNRTEAWVGDVSGASISVSDYEWNHDDFWAKHNRGSFRAACAHALVEGLETVKQRKAEAERKLEMLTTSENILEHAVSFT